MKSYNPALTILLVLFYFPLFAQDTVYTYEVASGNLTTHLLPSYNSNAIADSTDPFFGVHGVSSLPASPPASTYPASNVSLIQKASDYYSIFNFPYTAVTLIRFGFNITSAIIGRNTLLVFGYDVKQPHLHWRNLSDANPFFENGTIQYGHTKLHPVRFHTLNSPDYAQFAVVEVAENIGDSSGYFGFAFDTTQKAYDSLLLYNISYPKADNFDIYSPDSLTGDTMYMKYGYLDSYNTNNFTAFKGGDGEYVSPFFDRDYRIRGIRWSVSQNSFISRKGFYFLRYVSDSLSTSINKIDPKFTFNLFPNPATGSLTLDVPPGLQESAENLVIRNLTGQQVQIHELHDTTRKVVDVSEQPSGLYLAEVWGTEGLLGRVTFVKK